MVCVGWFQLDDGKCFLKNNAAFGGEQAATLEYYEDRVLLGMDVMQDSTWMLLRSWIDVVMVRAWSRHLNLGQGSEY